LIGCSASLRLMVSKVNSNRQFAWDLLRDGDIVKDKAFPWVSLPASTDHGLSCCSCSRIDTVSTDLGGSSDVSMWFVSTELLLCAGRQGICKNGEREDVSKFLLDGRLTGET